LDWGREKAPDPISRDEDTETIPDFKLKIPKLLEYVMCNLEFLIPSEARTR
jgi:hypothetical protein